MSEDETLTAEQAATKAVALARARKRGAREALEVAQNRLIAATVEVQQTDRRFEALRRKQGALEALNMAHDRFVIACVELGHAKRSLAETRLEEAASA
ncbi:MAG: hypothetical protein M0Z94_07600 [Dehalococcoidales bacterium]|nr:hypothetical protein [Dehalococcoidales bacterium]